MTQIPMLTENGNLLLTTFSFILSFLLRFAPLKAFSGFLWHFRAAFTVLPHAQHHGITSVACQIPMSYLDSTEI